MAFLAAGFGRVNRWIFGWQVRNELPQCLVELWRARIVMIAVRNDDELLWLVGRFKQLASELDGHDRVGIAVNL